MSKKISMIIQAAGLSRRQPPNKLLMKLGTETVIEKTVTAFVNFPLEIIVVLGYKMEKLKPILTMQFADKITIVENPYYHKGMASSIHTGIRAAGRDCDYYGFCNGDKPFIQRKTISNLLKELEEKTPTILIPVYQYRIGHPNFFSATLRDELLATTGEIGGRQIFRDHKDSALSISVEDKGVVLDMDQYLENEHDK
ncbi:MAG: nucleotidyltransferase family protein [Candidatus Marinimicrobia bacterium]|nr:nucleotidyltransferase family protein [Candidatus Neomarinimicrobiota bacterium]